MAPAKPSLSTSQPETMDWERAPVGRKHSYYLARENGALAAIRFMADADSTPIDDLDGTITFNGHKIFRVAYPTTVSYFLRLPDGNVSGAGFPGTGFQSLKRFAAGEIGTLSAVDNSTSYHGWSDLVATVREIILYERGKAPLVQLNVADPDATINPGDHSDHLMTAKVALDAASNMSCVRRVYYVDYASAKLPPNLNGQERDMKSAVFAVTLEGVFAFDHGTSWHHYDQSFIGRNYFRVEEPRGNCTATPAAVVPGRLWDFTRDPEGMLSTLPAIGTCVFGVFAGLLLRDSRISGEQKTLWLIAGGCALLVGGYLWAPQFPIIKAIWTSSFVLVTAGYSAILLGIIHHMVDVWKWRRWTTIFTWIGANAITLYVLNESVAQRIAGGDLAASLDRAVTDGAGGFVLHILALLCAITLARFMYRRKIFVRV